MKRVLITGAAGSIGRSLCAGFKGVYPELFLADIAPQDAAAPGETVMQLDIRNRASLQAAMEIAQTVNRRTR